MGRLSRRKSDDSIINVYFSLTSASPSLMLLPGDVPSGANVFFAPDEPEMLSGACCFPNSTCVDTGFVDCLERGGFPIGPGTSCADADCSGSGGPGDPPSGACCGMTGTCADDVSFGECVGSGGFPAPGATCEDVNPSVA